MTPAEIAALRERLREGAATLEMGIGDLYDAIAADLTSALALLDAQAAEIARLTADLQAMYDRWAGAVRNLTDDDAPAPAAEVAG